MCPRFGGTEFGRAKSPPRGASVCAGEDEVGEGDGLDLRRRDMSSLAVVKVNGA